MSPNDSDMRACVRTRAQSRHLSNTNVQTNYQGSCYNAGSGSTDLDGAWDSAFPTNSQ